MQVIKDRINTGKSINSDKLIAIVKKYDVISFDIFDTLLKRNVDKPSDVFTYMGQKIGNSKFAEQRIEAENKVRKIKKGSEITLQEIYKEFGKDYSQEELRAESKFLIANIDMFPVFKYSVKNKRVILTSDMYLPKDFILKILTREGMIGFEKIYLSSSLNKTKSSGNLFKYVIKDLGVEKDRVIHIGDSFESDYRIPKSIGIAAVHIPTHTKRSKYQLNGKNFDEKYLNNYINNTIPSNIDEYYRFGYEKFGVFLWGFCKWIHNSVKNEAINRIYFFSRDGLIMKKAFDSLYSDVSTYYLEVSRRALRVPVLWMNYEFEHVLDMISPSKLVPLSIIFDGVGLNIKDYQDLISKYEFNVDTYFDRSELYKNKKIREMYYELGADIEQVSRREYEFLVKYIKQNHIEGEFAIVDIGWSGGMQRYLCETLDSLEVKYKIKGYYIGVADYYKRNKDILPSLDLNGYLFDFLHDQNAVDVRSSFVGLFETLFLEQAGSVKNYVEENGVIKGNRIEYEYMQDGKPTYELQCVRKIQAGALDFVKKLRGMDINLSADTLFAGIEETGLRPTKEVLNLFANFKFFDEGEMNYLAKPRSIFYYIAHIKALKKDLLLSRWKIGFMKRLLKLNIDYYALYELLKKTGKYF